jgi:hypothetical protein
MLLCPNPAITTKPGVRYVDCGDGTLVDSNTGLMWEKTTGTIGTIPTNPPVTDVNHRYVWSNSGMTPDGGLFTYFLATLNRDTSSDGSNTCFANHCDWRIPNIAELKTIISLTAAGCGSGSPCIDPAFGPTLSLATEGTEGYWSSTTTARAGASTTTAGGSGYADQVDFGHGVEFYQTNMAFAWARAVRGGR